MACSTGLPLTTEPLELTRASTPEDPIEASDKRQLKPLAVPVTTEGFDPFLSQYQIASNVSPYEQSLLSFATQAGKPLQLMPLKTRPLLVQVPFNTFDEDPELGAYANSLQSELAEKGIAIKGPLSEHKPPEKRYSLWEWVLFDRHPWGRVSKERTAEVRQFAQDLANKPWTEVKELTRSFINSLRKRIYDSISRDIASQARMTFPDISRCQLTAHPDANGSPSYLVIR